MGINRFARGAATACLSILIASTAIAQPQDKDQQKCINGLNKAGSKVAKAQGKENSACIKNAGKGKEADATACLTADGKDKVGKAELKTAATETKACTVAPDFGATGAGTVNAAAKGQELALTTDVFGSDVTGAILTDKAGAACQSAIVKAYEKIADAKVKTFLKCKKDGLKIGTITSAAGIEACIDEIIADTRGKIGKAQTKLADAVTKKCAGVTLDTAFPGECVGAGVFADCVDAAVECRVCNMLNVMDGVARDCDDFDNGVLDSSCVPPPTTTTSTTTSTTSTTLPAPDWGLPCFASADCGTYCGGPGGCQCGAFLDSIGLLGSDAVCFFDCMDLGGDVVTCRDTCPSTPGAAPACDTSTAGGGGYPGVVTGPGACEPSGFAASVIAGGTSTAIKRFLVDFDSPPTAIAEATLFSGPPPPCDPGCPGSGGAFCDIGAPFPSSPTPDHFRLQIGAPPISAEAEVCDRAGVPITVCKFSPTGYAFVIEPGGTGICYGTGSGSPDPLTLTMFMSCHVSDGGGGFLHYSTGDFYFSTTF